MTLGDINLKLIKKNRKQFIVFGISICFALSMIAAYGILLFSPSITEVLMIDGSTYIIALGMYGITILGIIIFLFYANSIFLQSQMRETGVLFSLGMMPKAVIKMRNKQWDVLFFLGGIMGIILSIPISFMIWSFLTIFLSYTSHSFYIGWEGVFLSILLWIFMWIVLRIKNSVVLYKIDIIKILHSDSKNEKVKGTHPCLGILGMIAIPLGLIFFNITAVIEGLKNISPWFIGVTLIGIYLFTAQITTIGDVIKRFNSNFYRKNILLFNLVRQKGNQYTLSLFVSSVLIGLTVFSICFNGSSFLELYYQIKEDPYDYAILLGERQKELDRNKIETIAEKYNINLNDWITMDMLLIGREHLYVDHQRNEWGTEFAISESSFEELLGKNVSIPLDGFVYFEDSNDATFQTFSEKEGVFYNPTTHKEFRLEKSKLITEKNIVNNSANIDSFLVFNDELFKMLNRNIENEYHYRYYLFNGSNDLNCKKFQNELLDEIVSLSDGEIFDNYQERVIKDKLKAYSEDKISYKGNELYAARQWDFYPYAKQTQLDIQLESGAVYLLLIFFIAVIAFVSAIMIMGLKIAGTILQDRNSYQRAVYLGLKEKKLKRIIRGQIALIYFFPTICGCTTATFMINRFMEVSSVTHILEVTLMAIAISLIVLVIQCIIFGVLQKKLVFTTSNDVYERQ